MARPCCCRRIEGKPTAAIFKPAGVSEHGLEEVIMSLDEFEAVRLADREGLYQEEAAKKMKVSRSTFGRILKSAHGKIAEALGCGKVLKIEGGTIYIRDRDGFHCGVCRHRWRTGRGKPGGRICPRCQGRKDWANDPEKKTRKPKG